MKIRNIISAVAACAVAATAFVLPASAAESYKAGITFQTSSFMYRDDLSQDTILVWDNDLSEGVEVEGSSYVDATITGDGTYTVEMSGVEDGGWNMLKVDTEIDAGVNPDAVLTITGVELNGSAVDFDATACAMDNTVAVKGSDGVDVNPAVRAQLINVYDNLAAVPNETYTSVKVTFEVSGLGGAPADDDTNTDTDTAAPSTPAASDSKGSPDTGVEGVAIVAGAAIAAAGVVLLSKKRK
ncbi:MAG: NPXTG-anchored protein [Oscillospiraceae bacterium]|nr:NPXTG-anchored protein [Oscillospiraceae bacterium]